MTTRTPESEAFTELAQARAVMLTTFKRDGTAVGTPVWPIGRDGMIYATSVETSSKVKRIRRDGHVTLAACTQRGTVTGPTYAATARLLPPEETQAIVEAKTRRYGLMGKLMTLINRARGDAAQIGIAITLAEMSTKNGATRVASAEGEMPRKHFGQMLLTFTTVATGIIPTLADFNATHLLNPLWSRHDRFHGAWLNGVGLMQIPLGLWLLWSNGAERDLRMRLAALLPVVFFGGFLFAVAVRRPLGAALHDENVGPSLGLATRFDANTVFAAVTVVLSGVGYGIDRLATGTRRERWRRL